MAKFNSSKLRSAVNKLKSLERRQKQAIRDYERKQREAIRKYNSKINQLENELNRE